MASESEWLKIVASTCLGLFAGLIAEPLKSSMTSRRTQREISHAIRHDLKLLRAFLPFYRLNKYDAEFVSRRIELPVFNYHWSKNKGAFYESSHLRFLRFQCEIILSDAHNMKTGKCTKEEGLKSIHESIVSALESREPYCWQQAVQKYRIWRHERKYKGIDTLYIQGKVVPADKVVFVDNEGQPIPIGEGKLNKVPD